MDLKSLMSGIAVVIDDALHKSNGDANRWNLSDHGSN